MYIICAFQILKALDEMFLVSTSVPIKVIFIQNQRDEIVRQ